MFTPAPFPLIISSWSWSSSLVSSAFFSPPSFLKMFCPFLPSFILFSFLQHLLSLLVFSLSSFLLFLLRNLCGCPRPRICMVDSDWFGPIHRRLIVQSFTFLYLRLNDDSFSDTFARFNAWMTSIGTSWFPTAVYRQRPRRWPRPSDKLPFHHVCAFSCQHLPYIWQQAWGTMSLLYLIIGVYNEGLLLSLRNQTGAVEAPVWFSPVVITHIFHIRSWQNSRVQLIKNVKHVWMRPFSV